MKLFLNYVDIQLAGIARHADKCFLNSNVAVEGLGEHGECLHDDNTQNFGPSVIVGLDWHMQRGGKAAYDVYKMSTYRLRKSPVDSSHPVLVHRPVSQGNT